MTWDQWLADQAGGRERAGLTRRLRTRSADDPTVDLAGNDYLGLARDPAVRAAAAEASFAWGAGAGASRLVTGTLQVHADLEDHLADYLGQPAALVLSSGYAANLAVVTALADSSTRIVSDAHVHASLIDAVRLSRAEVAITPHGDVRAVAAALATTDGRAMVLVESIYSVLGDAADLTALADVTEEHGALLVVDEAHGLGVHGPGLVAELGLAGRPHVVLTATLSKALGSQGGAVLSTRAIRDHLVNTARPFIFDTALAPAAAAGASAALQQIRRRPELGARVLERVRHLAERLAVEPPAGAVLSVPMPSPTAAIAAQQAAAEQGIRVGCFRPPSVPDGVSRLRITGNAGVDDVAWKAAVETLVAVVQEHR